MVRNIQLFIWIIFSVLALQACSASAPQAALHSGAPTLDNFAAPTQSSGFQNPNVDIEDCENLSADIEKIEADENASTFYGLLRLGTCSGQDLGPDDRLLRMIDLSTLRYILTPIKVEPDLQKLPFIITIPDITVGLIEPNIESRFKVQISRKAINANTNVQGSCPSQSACLESEDWKSLYTHFQNIKTPTIPQPTNYSPNFSKAPEL